MLNYTHLTFDLNRQNMYYIQGSALEVYTSLKYIG
jgi:hypothetical protein